MSESHIEGEMCKNLKEHAAGVSGTRGRQRVGLCLLPHPDAALGS